MDPFSLARLSSLTSLGLIIKWNYELHELNESFLCLNFAAKAADFGELDLSVESVKSVV